MQVTWEILNYLKYEKGIFKLFYSKQRKWKRVYILECTLCGDEFISQKTNGKFCSNTCKFEGRKGEGHPLFGKTVSKSTKDKISKTNEEKIKKYEKDLLSKYKESYFIITTGNKKLKNVLCSFDDLNNYVTENNFISNLKHLYNIKEEIEEMIIPQKIMGFTHFIQEIKHILKGNRKNVTLFSYDCLWRRGWEDKEIKEFISNQQQKNSYKYYYKLINLGYSEEEIFQIRSDKSKEIWSQKSIEEKRRNSCRCIEYWIDQGYDEEGAKQKVKEINDNSSLKSFIERYGENKGKEKYNDFIQKQKMKSPRCIEYWIYQGYDEEEAKKKVSEFQVMFSLDKCIEKYGEKKGYRVWKERQERWQNTLQQKSEEEKEDINRRKLPNHRSSKEKMLCEELDCDSQIYVKGYLFDMGYDNNLIEFNGDYWHCNPLLFSNDFFNKSIQLLAEEKWELDNKKKKVAENQGYNVLVVWEYDFDNNYDEVINQCRKFLRTGEK